MLPAMHPDQIRAVAAAAAARIGIVIEAGSALPAARVGLKLDHVRRGVVLARRRGVSPDANIARDTGIAAGAKSGIAAHIPRVAFDIAR